MVKLKIDPALYEQARQAAQKAGYSTVEEFVAHCIESEIKRLKIKDAEAQVADQLRGLGYIQ